MPSPNYKPKRAVKVVHGRVAILHVLLDAPGTIDEITRRLAEKTDGGIVYAKRTMTEEVLCAERRGEIERFIGPDLNPLRRGGKAPLWWRPTPLGRELAQADVVAVLKLFSRARKSAPTP